MAANRSKSGNPPSGTRLLYNLSGPDYAFENARQGWLKVSLVEDLNDPFELLPANLYAKSIREAFKAARRRAQRQWGVVCMTETWQNPVMWSHYGAKHTGVCLGFDVAEHLAVPVSYEPQPQKVSTSDIPGETSATDAFVERFLTVKFDEWRYEREHRILVKLDEVPSVNGHRFFPASRHFRLREIILGARCTLTLNKARRIAEALPQPVYVKKARIAFKKFAVVENRRTRLRKAPDALASQEASGSTPGALRPNRP